jgi:hypothetical protein
MFWKRKKPEVREIDPQLGFDFTPWTGDYYQANAGGFADHCRARGRYELAKKFRSLDAEYYSDSVVNNDDPVIESNTTPEMRERFEMHLSEKSEELSRFDSMIRERDAVLDNLRNHPEGLTRRELEDRIQFTNKVGVLLNQMERGEWIVREGSKPLDLIRLGELPESDHAFLAREIPGNSPGLAGR